MSEHTWKTNANLPSVDGSVRPHFLAQFRHTLSGDYTFNIKLQSPSDSSGKGRDGFGYVAPGLVGLDPSSAPSVTIIPAELDPTNTLFLHTFQPKSIGTILCLLDLPGS